MRRGLRPSAVRVEFAFMLGVCDLAEPMFDTGRCARQGGDKRRG